MTVIKAVGLFALFIFPLSQVLSETCTSCSPLGYSYLGTTVAASFGKLGKRKPKISYESGGILITDAYPLKSNHPVAATISVNGGYEFTGAKWKPAIALGGGVYFNPQDYHFRGKVIETAEGSPSSALYKYKYKISSTRAIAEMQFTWMLPYLSPFINVGIGPAWNKSMHYREKALSHSVSSLPLFRTHTNIHFAYQAGLGISAAFKLGCLSGCACERISLGYRYVNAGETLFRTRSSVYPYKLKPGTLSSNDVYFGYTHLF